MSHIYTDPSYVFRTHLKTRDRDRDRDRDRENISLLVLCSPF